MTPQTRIRGSRTRRELAYDARRRQRAVAADRQRLENERHTATIADAIRWARAGARRSPGIQFIAIVGDRMYCRETDQNGNPRRIT